MALLIDGGGVSMCWLGRRPVSKDSNVSLNLGQMEVPISDRTFHRLSPSKEARRRLAVMNTSERFVGFTLRKKSKSIF